MANRKGLKPIYWDQANQMFIWKTGRLIDPDNQRVLTGGAALPP
jgi:endo-1,4-beta-D-glucanase Y